MYRTSLTRLLGGSLLVATVAALNACGGGAADGEETTTASGGSSATPTSSAAGTTGSTGAAGKSSSTPSTAGTAGAKAPGGTMTSGVMSAAGKSGGAGGSTASAAAGSTGAAGGGTSAAAGGGAGGSTASAAAGSTGGGAAGGAAAAAGSSASAGGMLGGPLKYTGMFTTGMTIAPKYKCPMDQIGSGMGENKSPPLAWTGGPADTKSFAIVLFDTQYMMLHWAIWDIPATVNELPEGLPPGYELANPMGAHQAANMGSDKHAYYGPCSSPGGPLPAGKYEYRLYALKTDKLGLMESTAATQAQTAIEGMMLEKAVWVGDPM